MATDPEKFWRCKRCKTVTAHDACAVRFGMVECPLCLPLGFVGLLERHDPSSGQPSRCSFCWQPIQSGKEVSGKERFQKYHDGCHATACEVVP